MTTKPHDNESRFSALSRIQTALERLEAHMIALAEVNQDTRKMLEEGRESQAAQFRPVEPVRRSPFGPHRSAGAGGGQA